VENTEAIKVSSVSEPGCRARRIVLGGFFRAGSYYGGHFTRTNLVLTVQPLPQLHLNTDNSLDKVDLPGGSFDSLISALSVSNYFSLH
jgi:hypothetical protein